MATITQQLGNIDDDLARRIMVTARRIAPCLDSLPEGSEKQLDAIAILKGVIAELPETGTRRVRSKGRNGTTISYADVDSAFTIEARADLRSLCAAASVPGLPEGRFPEERELEKLWPEERYR